MDIMGQDFTSFYSRSFPCWKTEKQQQESFNGAGCSLSKTIYIKRFSGVLELKYEEQLSWSKTSNWDEISFTKVNFWGNTMHKFTHIMHKFTHIHCWTANRCFSRARLYVDDEAGMRSSVQVVRITSGCRHSSSLAVLKVPSSYSVLPKKPSLMFAVLSVTKVSHL